MAEEQPGAGRFATRRERREAELRVQQQDWETRSQSRFAPEVPSTGSGGLAADQPREESAPRPAEQVAERVRQQQPSQTRPAGPGQEPAGVPTQPTAAPEPTAAAKPERSAAPAAPASPPVGPAAPSEGPSADDGPPTFATRAERRAYLRARAQAENGVQEPAPGASEAVASEPHPSAHAQGTPTPGGQGVLAQGAAAHAGSQDAAHPIMPVAQAHQTGTAHSAGATQTAGAAQRGGLHDTAAVPASDPASRNSPGPEPSPEASATSPAAVPPSALDGPSALRPDETSVLPPVREPGQHGIPERPASAPGAPASPLARAAGPEALARRRSESLNAPDNAAPVAPPGISEPRTDPLVALGGQPPMSRRARRLAGQQKTSPAEGGPETPGRRSKRKTPVIAPPSTAGIAVVSGAVDVSQVTGATGSLPAAGQESHEQTEDESELRNPPAPPVAARRSGPLEESLAVGRPSSRVPIYTLAGFVLLAIGFGIAALIVL